ncbi:MAG: response regulator transcription factor [Caldilineaceae bacterium]|nr:response regulator transcription factor [Caldilineaceae bacterium]
MKNDTIRVMLADDHEILRQGLRALLQLEENILVVGEANSGEALLQEIEQGVHPDVVLMDVSMQGMSGIEATRRLKQRLPAVRVIGLTASEEDDAIVGMLRAGACSYLVKSLPAHDLVRAIRSAYYHEPWVPASIQRRLHTLVGRQGAFHSSYRPSQSMPSLTRREKDVIKTLLDGYTNKEIARHLVISERTVQTHLSNIFSKMNVASRTEAVLVAMRDGWLMNH